MEAQFATLHNNKKRWWRAPELNDGTKERRATWLELFFDLVFVAAVAQLSHHLADHFSWHTLFEFAILYAPIWWVWIGATFYNQRFETNDVSHRFFTFLLMLPIAGFAVTISTAPKGGIGFILCYMTARLIIIGLWLRAGYHHEKVRPVTTSFVIGFLLSVIIWGSSILVPDMSIRYGLWAFGMLIELITPLFTVNYQMNKMPRFSGEHIVERFGLFTILVLGESIIAVVNALGDVGNNLNFGIILCAVLGLLMAFGLWWIYFDDVVGHPDIPTKAPWNIVWVYAHVVLSASMTATGAALLLIINPEHATHAAYWLLCGSLALSLVTISLIEFAHDAGMDDHDHETQCALLRIIGAAFILLIGLYSGSMDTAAFMAFLIVVIGLQVISGIRLHYIRPHNH